MKLVRSFWIGIDSKHQPALSEYTSLTDSTLVIRLNSYAKIELLPNVELENILGLYSNYLEKAQNVDIDYTANLSMRVNNLLTANITLQAIYDDNAVQGFQIRQALGIGVTYKLK